MNFFSLPAALLPIRNRINTALRAATQPGQWLAYGLSLTIVMLSLVGSAKAQNALQLDGAFDQVIIPHHPSLNLTSQATYEAWIKWGGGYNLFMKGSYGWGIGIDGNIEWWQQFSQGAGPNSTGTAIPTGTWTHIAVTIVHGGTLKFYINGNLITTTTGNIVNNTEPLYIGTQGTCNCNFINTSLDELRIWNVVRTDAEISASMNTELIGNEAGLVSYYKFNQGTANGTNTGITTLTDLVGCNNGTLTNFALSGATSNWVAGKPGLTAVADPAVSQPEINVQGNSTSIVDGDNTPVLTDHTSFGNVGTGLTLERIYTVQNTGAGTLSISSIVSSGTNAAKFVVSGAPTSIAAGASANFTVTYTPGAAATHNATITINNTDCNEGVYDFAVQGTGTVATEINVKGNAVDIVSGDVTPVIADYTNFGSINIGDFLDRIYTIENTGSAVLNVMSVVSSGTNAAKFVVSGAPTTVAAGASATFTVRYTPTAAGTDNATITITNNDGNEGTYTFAVQGNLNNALNFDGTNDEVGATVNVVGSSFTIETWFNNTSSSSPFQTILGIGTAGLGNQAIHLTFENTLFRVGFYSNDITIPWTRPSLNVWHHLAVTHDYASKVSTVYLDGVKIGSGTHGANYSGNTTLLIGRSGFANDNFIGSIDEVRIWNVVRTCGEINAVKDRELAGTETGLLAYYNFNQGIASGDNTGLITLNDLAGTAENGTLTNFTGLGGGATSNWVDGSGNGVLGTTPALQPDLSVSVGASGSTKDVGGYATGSTNDFTYTIQNTGGVDLSLTGTPIVNLTGGSDFAVLTQPSATTIAAGGSLTFVVRFTPVVGTNSATFSIASTDCEGAYTFTLTGKGITATPSAVRGSMMNLDGTASDYITIGDIAALKPTNQLTVEAWIKTNNTGATQQTIISTGVDVGVKGYHINTTNGNIWFNNEFNPIATANGKITAGVWHHVAITYDAGVSGARVYIDGVLEASNSGSASALSYDANPLGFGTLISNPGFYNYDGKLDEVRIWNVARTRDQIRENMHNTLSGSESGLVAYYQFNEASGNATDAISGNNGTLTNAVRAASTVSVAKSAVAPTRLTISGASTQTFGNMQIRFTAMSPPAPGDEFVISQLEELPYNNVSGVTSTVTNYWTVRQFGTQTFTYDQVTFTIPSSHTISAADVATPANLTLYKRTTNSGTSSWGSAIGTGSSANNTTKGIVYNISPAQTSFSEFVPASTTSILFPVEWLSFEATPTDNAVVLDWSTGSEQNNASFTAERSLNGLDFEDIGMVAAAGNSNSATSYTYTDAALPVATTLHYRIRQTDMDGSTSHSEIRTVTLGRTNGLAVYPNPATNQLTVRVPNGIYTVALADAAGRMVRSATTSGQPTTLNFDLSNLAAGVYTLRAGTTTVRVVKE